LVRAPHRHALAFAAHVKRTASRRFADYFAPPLPVPFVGTEQRTLSAERAGARFAFPPAEIVSPTRNVGMPSPIAIGIDASSELTRPAGSSTDRSMIRRWGGARARVFSAYR